MDETTRTARDASTGAGSTPDAETGDPAAAGVSSPGTGWSNPTAGQPGELPRRDPWATRPADAGEEARPNDTRVLPTRTAFTSPPLGDEPPAEHTPVTAAPRRRGTALLLVMALGAGAIGGAAGAAAFTALTDEPAPVVSSLQTGSEDANGSATYASVEGVADQVLPSVVMIEAGAGGGSGVIISSDGQILTNNHVVAAAQGGEIRVVFHDGTSATAEVVGTDPTTDLAVIEVDAPNELQPADLGSSAELRVGAQVVAIGSPLGLDGTVTSGIVSALDRPVTAGDRQGGNPTRFSAVQTDAPINPGNSGGPLVNMSGQVVGINSAIATIPGTEGSIGLGFSIPIDQARIVAEQLIETGTASHAMLQIGVNDARGDTAGALVAEVQPGGAAESAGLEEGDVIIRLNDRLVVDSESLIASIRSYRPGDEVTLTVLRDGEELTIEVTLASSNPVT